MASFFRGIALTSVLSLVLLLAGGASAGAAGGAELAIGGYDPVAYFTEGKATRGSPEIEHEWDEHRYRFARVEHRELFKADPARYAPQFANYCAMALTRGEVIVANPEHWLISSGKLYIFGAPSGVGAFPRDLTGNIDKANRNRDLIEKPGGKTR